MCEKFGKQQQKVPKIVHVKWSVSASSYKLIITQLVATLTQKLIVQIRNWRELVQTIKR